jgi:hypothetical protein
VRKNDEKEEKEREEELLHHLTSVPGRLDHHMYLKVKRGGRKWGSWPGN